MIEQKNYNENKGFCTSCWIVSLYNLISYLIKLILNIRRFLFLNQFSHLGSLKTLILLTHASPPL